MADTRVNPLQEDLEEDSAWYVELVYEYMDEFAPYGPWWSEKLSPEQQLFRWEGTAAQPGPRADVIPWLEQAYPLLAAGHKGAGWGPEDMLRHVADIFTDPAAPDLIPEPLILDPAQNKGFIALIELYQAAGPKDMQTHIAKLERMHEGHMEGVSLLKNTDQPRAPHPPDRPAPLPVSLDGSSIGPPHFGDVPLGTVPTLSG